MTIFSNNFGNIGLQWVNIYLYDGIQVSPYTFSAKIVNTAPYFPKDFQLSYTVPVNNVRQYKFPEAIDDEGNKIFHNYRFLTVPNNTMS